MYVTYNIKNMLDTHDVEVPHIQVIEQKECEQKMLQGQLDEALNSCHQQKDLTALKTKEQIITIFSEILETELQCSICNELFVQVIQSRLSTPALSLRCRKVGY